MWSALQRLLKYSSLHTWHVEGEHARNSRRNVDVRRGQRVIQARLEVWPMGHHGNVRIGWRETAVVAPSVDRARVADARAACHGHIFIERETDDDVRTPASDRVLRVD